MGAECSGRRFVISELEGPEVTGGFQQSVHIAFLLDTPFLKSTSCLQEHRSVTCFIYAGKAGFPEF